MRKAILFILYSIFALMMSAVPAKRERHILKLADGSIIEATAMGDESLHFYQTDDGQCLLCDSLDIAHFVAPQVIQERWEAKRAKRQAFRTRRNAGRRQNVRNRMHGSKRGLVILVQFPDVPFYYSKETFESFFNENGYRDDINKGSVHDYFYDASYRLFDFSFDVVGPVTASHNLSYYGGNNANGDDKYPATLVAEIVQMLDDEVDYSNYDWDGDGEVEHIYVIHSGYDEAQSSKRNDIWSHAWTLTEAKDEGDGNGPVTVDGVRVDSYATSSELRNKTGTQIAGIGTACHEFSHCFGLPDFYDTAGYNFGMNSWDILDYGSYNGNGGTPAGYTSYERMFCGWLDPIELTNPIAVEDMPALTAEPVAYILRNTGKYDEYFLFENRQKGSWDKYLGGHGLLILHVDYDSQAWQENTVNTVRSHQRMTIIPADNSLYSGSLAGDPWPGTSGKTELSDNSSPSGKFFNANAEGNKLMNHSITEISETSRGYISFIFDEEALGLKANHDAQFMIHNDIFDLSGRKCSKPTKGIYIRRTQDGRIKKFMTHEL